MGKKERAALSSIGQQAPEFIVGLRERESERENERASVFTLPACAYVLCKGFCLSLSLTFFGPLMLDVLSFQTCIHIRLGILALTNWIYKTLNPNCCILADSRVAHFLLLLLSSFDGMFLRR